MDAIVDEDFIVIARRMMKEIMYDSGKVMHYQSEFYPDKHVMAIAFAAKPFFECYPLLMNDEDLEQICSGEFGENEEKYGQLEGYRELLKALNSYFDNE